MKPFENLFDILDDKSDAMEFANDTLNEYFLSGHLNVIVNDEEKDGGEEEDRQDENAEKDTIENDTAMDTSVVIIDEETEDVLSHKLSQLSTKSDNEEKTSTCKKRQRSSTPSRSSNRIPKKVKSNTDLCVNIDDNDQDPIPTYLLPTNESFERLLQEVINQTTNSSISVDDLRQLAILKHHIMDLRIQKEVRTVYLQSGIGTLKESEPELIETDPRVWPSQVKSEILKQQIPTAAAAAAITTTDSTLMETESAVTISDKEPDHTHYEQFLRRHLQQLTNKIERYQEKFTKKKHGLSTLTSTMEVVIRDYVHEHGIKPLQMKRDLKITMMKYDYDAEILEQKYLQENPNPYQVNVANRLCELRSEAEKSKRDLIELRQRVFLNRPSPAIDATISTSLTTATTTAMSAQDEKVVQRKKIDLIAIHIRRAEMRYDSDRKLFYQELAKMWQNHRHLVKHQGMTTALTNLMDQRITNITDKFRELYRYRLKYYLRSPYGDLESGKDPHMKTIGFLSPLIIHTSQHHPFTDQQIQLLNRGPTYVPPYQLHISSSRQSMDDVIKKLYAPLKHQLAGLQTKYEVDIHHIMQFDDLVYRQFRECFSSPLPMDVRRRALYEMRLVQTIRSSLREHKLILRRTADNLNTFYLGNRHEFESKANACLSESSAYEILLTLNDEMDRQRQIQVQLNQRSLGINRALKILQGTRALKEELVQKLLLDPSQIQLPYLYFLPDVSRKNEMKLVPMITSQHSAQAKLATFLHRLLRPFAQETTQPTTFYNEADFMQKLKHYTDVQHRLTPTTLFCVIKIMNYYTLDTHENMIDKVLSFLRGNSASDYLKNISFSTIKNLLQLVLFNHIFGYQNRIYTITKGLPNSMPLSEMLADIYVHQCQRTLVDRVALNQELFGRYKDQIFFTWKASKDELHSYLQTMKERYPNVEFQQLIGSSVQYLDAYIDNRNGHLYSRVYHHPILQSYTLPYVVGHSKVQHSHWLRFALIRAACYCSLVEDFNQERIYLELTYLANGYSLLFVESHVRHFFNHFNAEDIRYSTDQSAYDKFRRQWFNFMTHQREMSEKLQQTKDHGHLLRFSYLYEYGQKNEFHRKFHRLWTRHFPDHPKLSDKYSTVVMSAKHVHSLNTLLTQQKSVL